MWKSKSYRKLETERDEANAALRHMMDENVELAKRLRETEAQLSRARADNRTFCMDISAAVTERDRALEDAREAYGHYCELRDRVETLAHRVEEITGEMIGTVHGL